MYIWCIYDIFLGEFEGRLGNRPGASRKVLVKSAVQEEDRSKHIMAWCLVFLSNRTKACLDVLENCLNSSD